MKNKAKVSPVNELPSAHDFVYWDADSKKSIFPLHDISIPPVPKPLIVLNNKTLQCQGKSHNYGFTNQTSGWYLIDGDKRTYLFQERGYFPYSWLVKPTVEYWLSCACSDTIIGLIRMLKEKGCDVTKWNGQQAWYSDHVEYFLQTEDFDEALKFLGYAYVCENEEKKVEVPA